MKNDVWDEGGHTDDEDIEFFEQSLKDSSKTRYNIPDEVMLFMDRNKDVREALDGLRQYNIEHVVDAWNDKLMTQIMGQKHRADFVLQKLKTWLRERGEGHGSVVRPFNMALNPYFVSI